MEQPSKVSSHLSSASMKYLRRLNGIVDIDPYKTHVIIPKLELKLEPPKILPTADDVNNSSNSPELQTNPNFEECKQLEVPMEISSILNESTISTDVLQKNLTFISVNNDKSTRNTEFLKSPMPKRQRHFDSFNDDPSKSHFLNLNSGFFESIKFEEIVDTDALFCISSSTVGKVQSQRIKPKPSEFPLVTNFNFNQLDVNDVTVTDGIINDDCEQPNNVEASFIDNTMIPKSYRDGLLEKTLMNNETVVVNTAYMTRSLMKTTRHAIDNFYKIQKPDWNAVVHDMKKMMEPNFDYMQQRLFPDMMVEIGEEKFNVNLIEELDCDGIDESLQEIEQSFNKTHRSIVASTPNKSLIQDQSAIDARIDENLEPWKLNLLDRENKDQNESTTNFQDVKPLTEYSETNLSNASATELQVPSVNDNFNFSIIDPADFMFSRTIYKDLPNAFDQPAEPSFHGFAEEDPIELAPQSDQNLESQKMSTLLEILEQQNALSPSLADKRRAAIITQIGNIFHSLLQSLVHHKPMVLKIRTIRNWKDCEMNNEILSQNETKITTKSVNFSNKASERTFTVTLTIMCEIYKMLMRNLTCTKRELYYRDVELFRNQESVNKALDTICNMLNVQEFELGILSSSKGLIAGNLIINFDDERIDCSTTRAIPPNPSGITSFESEAEMVLVVEKDTVFQRLVNDSINFDQIKSRIILITAKGYPDVNTRVLIKKMSLFLDKPIYILVDADPHGIEIMCTYKYGSLMKIHNSEHLAVPSIIWIGIHPSDIETLDVTHVDLTDADLKKVDELLQRPYMNPFLKSQLSCLKNRRVKAEIESIYHYSIDYLINEYIPRKIRTIEMPPIR